MGGGPGCLAGEGWVGRKGQEKIRPGAQIYDKCSYNLEKKKYLHI